MKPGDCVRPARAPPTEPALIAVWDPLLRAMHWALALCVGLAWATTEWAVDWHRPVGWTALAIASARVAWGFAGPRHARFRQFVRGPGATWRHARLVLQGRAPRHVGHNPLGAWMVLALLASIAALALTGWLYTTDLFFGDEAVERAHRVLARIIVGLAACHVVGVATASMRQRENLVAAMTHGAKREARGSDID